MVFSSYEFIFLFLPIVLIVYFLLAKLSDKKYQHLFLVLASMFFYGYFNVSYLLIIVSSICVNYIIAKFIKYFGDKKKPGHSKLFMIAGIIFNIGLLGYFKYYDFFIENINAVFGAGFVLKHIMLPLGISFFTFQQFSFLISIYKGEEKLEGFIDYCLFVSFFPQLVAGPIVLYKEMMPQFVDESRRKFNTDNFAKGIYVFAIGLFKKIVIADTMALFVDNGFGMLNLSFSAAWAATLSYTLQIYFDFSGYSDMAIGLGKMFNIDIPVNFLSPYKSESISEFWRRWHITLGRALSTYVYIPMGGNRKGKLRTYINLFLTFMVSGLWHGANWTFVLWGAFHGFCVVFERMFKRVLAKIPKPLKIAGTFLVVHFLWVLFRAESFDMAMTVYRGMFNFGNIGISSLAAIVDDGIINFPTAIDIAYIGILILVLMLIVFLTKNTVEKAKLYYPNNKNMAFTIILLCISIIHLSRQSVFIYFNF